MVYKESRLGAHGELQKQVHVTFPVLHDEPSLTARVSRNYSWRNWEEANGRRKQKPEYVAPSETRVFLNAKRKNTDSFLHCPPIQQQPENKNKEQRSANVRAKVTGSSSTRSKIQRDSVDENAEWEGLKTWKGKHDGYLRVRNWLPHSVSAAMKPLFACIKLTYKYHTWSK